jgi:predicted phosphodiesterase
MPKLFCLSDIHGFYDEMIEALDAAGFDKDNPDHYLISCGDCFDRGEKPEEVMDYLAALERAILVKGNHEDLFMDCVERGYPLDHDIHNGTDRTILRLGGDLRMDFQVASWIAYRKAKDFIYSMCNYFETQNYIFVHGYVPIAFDDSFPEWYQEDRIQNSIKNWRNGTDSQWESARWFNGIQLAHDGFTPDKTVVFGHWHCSLAWALETGTPEFGPGSKFAPFYGDRFIAIDGCTAYTKKVNVIVINDELIK